MATPTVKKSSKLSSANQDLLNSKRLQQLEYKVQILTWKTQQEEENHAMEHYHRISLQKKKDIFMWGVAAGL